VLGALLMVMSVGLLLRSRLAWIMAVLVTSASLALALLAPVRSASSLLTLYNSLLLVFLILGHRRFPRSSLAVATIFALTNAMLLLGLAVLGSYELGKDFSPPITDFGTAFYYAVVTMTTVGYGDILPRTPEARFFVSGIIILGITVFATSLSAILMPLINSRMQRLLQPGEGPMERTNHYVIFGDTALSRNSYKELQARNQPVTFILRRASEESLYQEADVVIGDGSDLDVLRRAGADKAKAVLALSDDDSENAFVILAARELAEGIKMVAVVNDAKNLNRMRRVQPDLIISPQVLGGELLAMALSGETFDSENLMERLFHFRRT
jgi:voltage-gated potassium channel